MITKPKPKLEMYSRGTYEKEIFENKSVFFSLFVLGFVGLTIGLYINEYLILILGKILTFLALISYINIKHARVILEVKNKWL